MGRMTKIEVELEDEELADLEEFVRHHPNQFKTPSDALKRMAGLKMYRKMKQTVDPERKKAPILACEVGIPNFYPCALNEILDEEGKTYQDFINDTCEAAIKILQKALDSGEYSVSKSKEIVIPDSNEALFKWQENHPDVTPIVEVESVRVKGEPK
jgi:hypothetical protein